MTFVSELLAGLHRAESSTATWTMLVGRHVGPLTVAAAVVGSTVLVAYAVTLLFLRPRNELAELIEPFRLRQAPVPAAETASGQVEMPLPALRWAAAKLSVLAESRGLRHQVEMRLTRAGLPVGVGEFLLMALAALVVLTLAGGLTAGVVGLVTGVLAGAVVPAAVLQVLVERRSRRFAAQLPDVIKLLAASMRAGFSLIQSLDSVVAQASDPIQMEMRRALAAARLGVPVEDALAEAAERTGNRDLAWTVVAVRIQREVGGNLAEILDTVWETMTQRQQLRREVRTLTAEGRISAIIVSALPVGIGMFIYAVNRPYIKTLFTSFGGELALLGAVLLELAGAWWMYRTVQIEV